MTDRKIQYWVIPPDADGQFVACMEEVLDTYEEPYDSDFPVVWTNSPSSFTRRRENRSRRPAIILAVWITSTNAAEPPAYSCSPSRLPVGAK